MNNEPKSRPIQDEGEPLVTLGECQPGLFEFRGMFGFKSEYHTNRQSDAYVVASGEYFWGGTSDPGEREKLMVRPVSPPFAQPEPTKCSECGVDAAGIPGFTGGIANIPFLCKNCWIKPFAAKPAQPEPLKPLAESLKPLTDEQKEGLKPFIETRKADIALHYGTFQETKMGLKSQIEICNDLRERLRQAEMKLVAREPAQPESQPALEEVTEDDDVYGVPSLPEEMPPADRKVYESIASLPPENRTFVETLFKKYADMLFLFAELEESAPPSSQVEGGVGGEEKDR